MIPLPPRLEKLIGTSPGPWEPSINNPNCWNATQMFHDKHVKRRYTFRKEMDIWLKNRTLKVDSLRPKDILVFRSKGRLIHTAVALSSRSYFHKFGTKGKYEIISRVKLVKHYGNQWTIHRVNPNKK